MARDCRLVNRSLWRFSPCFVPAFFPPRAQALSRETRRHEAPVQAFRVDRERARRTSCWGGSRTRPRGLEDLTKEELYVRAQEADIPGRSEMSKEQLVAALRARS